MSSRSSRIKKMVRKRSNGCCELCNKKVTLMDKKGNPFLIPHHIIQLSDGGKDDLYNVAGVCSRCHDEIHYGINGDSENEKLRVIIKEKQKKIDEENILHQKLKRQRNLSSNLSEDLETRRKRVIDNRERRKKELENEMKNEFRARSNFRL